LAVGLAHLFANGIDITAKEGVQHQRDAAGLRVVTMLRPGFPVKRDLLADRFDVLIQQMG
jgi:hypothetical protein